MIRNIRLYFLIIAMFLYGGLQVKGIGFDVKKVIQSGDINRSVFHDSTAVHLYQGNGRFGCSYGAFGLHVNPENLVRDSKYGRTQYMCLDHFVRAKYGSDYLLPLARIYWEKDPVQISEYNQTQSFYDGTMTTSFHSKDGKIRVETWFDPVEKELAGITITLKGKASNVILAPCSDVKVHYDQQLRQVVQIKQVSDQWQVELECLGKRSSMFLKTSAKVAVINGTLSLTLHQGKNTILLSANKPVKVSARESLMRNIDWWKAKWENIGCLSIPDKDAQKMWVRSMAGFLSTYVDEKNCLPPPCGLTGNGWPFNFPQDMSYISPVLLATGNLNIVKSWVETWAEGLPGMLKYTERLLKVKGILCPWVFPYGDFQGYQTPEPPNIFYYEIHNSGYLSRMADDVATFVNDNAWTKKYADPIIKETAEFFKSVSKKESDGLWHIFITPSVGQDELGGRNQKDYLCALYSAEYCFQNAIRHNLDMDGSYARILKDGLAFPTLLSKRGYYFSCAGSGEKDFGNQKHPIQLNALTYLPVDLKIEKSSLSVYNLRYDITADAKQPFFHGWSLGTFLLAGSRIGDVSGWQNDWDNLRKSDNVDPEWIQVYESSGTYNYSFYTTTNGLIVQSLINNLVSDWYGKLEIAKCNPWKGTVMFKDIYSKLGVRLSGMVENDKIILTMVAWKDCTFNLRGQSISMKKDAEKNLTFSIK